VKVAGLDISLTSTGLALVDDMEIDSIRTQRVLSAPVKPADGSTPTLAHRQDRLMGVEDRIAWALGQNRHGARGIDRWPDLVLVEGPSLGSTGGQQMHESAGNWHRIVRRLHVAGVLVAEVTPSQVKQYATGSGATSGKNKVEKHHVIAAVRANYGDYAAHITSNDEADALILAAIGCRYLGHPIESAPLPPENLRALKKIRWPERKLV
jgi:crossover junction endodeoxyribonuclease RuvC